MNKAEWAAMGFVLGVVALALWLSFGSDIFPDARRDACRAGLEHMLKIGGAVNTDTRKIGTDAYMTDAEIDSILETK